MLRVVHTNHEPTSVSAIRRAERSLKVAFPNDYFAFLLEYNGGVVEPSCVRVKYPGGTIFEIRHLYGIRPDDRHSDVVRQTRRLRERLPVGAVTIGGNASDDQILLLPRVWKNCRIVVWDWYGEHPKPLRNCYPLAASFRAFLNLLID